MNSIALSRLLSDGRSADFTVAWRGGVPLPFARFSNEVASVAARLRGLGYRRTALVCKDSYAFAVGLFGLLHGGADVVLPPNNLPGTIETMRGAFDLFVDDSFIAGTETPPGDIAPLDAERPSLFFFTSGSTGEPKPVVKSLGMFEREAQTLDSLWGQNSGSGPVFATVSHQHVYGLTFKLTWPLSTGRPFIAETHDLWETLLTDLEPNAVIVTSPAHLSRLGGVMPLPGARRPARIFTAGAPLPVAAVRDAEQILGVTPTEIFGSSETGAFATRLQENGDEPWRLFPGVAMRCDNDGRLSLLSSYIAKEWYETADIVDPVSGGFRFRGRADRIVKIEGKRINLTDVEQAIARLPWVTAVAAIVISGDPARLAAAVVASEAGQVRLAELGAFRFGRSLRQELSDHLEPAGLPRHWRFVASLPSGALGKRRDSDIRALFGDRS